MIIIIIIIIIKFVRLYNRNILKNNSKETFWITIEENKKKIRKENDNKYARANVCVCICEFVPTIEWESKFIGSEFDAAIHSISNIYMYIQMYTEFLFIFLFVSKNSQKWQFRSGDLSKCYFYAIYILCIYVSLLLFYLTLLFQIFYYKSDLICSRSQCQVIGLIVVA